MMQSTTRTWSSESIISSGVLGHGLGKGSIRAQAPALALVDGKAGIRHQGLRPQEDLLAFRRASARPSGLAFESVESNGPRRTPWDMIGGAQSRHDTSSVASLHWPHRIR